MFLRRTERKKNGKTHCYWNIVENKRLDDGRVVQRHVLYLGEINSSQAVAWQKAIEVVGADAGGPRTNEPASSDDSPVSLAASKSWSIRSCCPLYPGRRNRVEQLLSVRLLASY